MLDSAYGGGREAYGSAYGGLDNADVLDSNAEGSSPADDEE